MGVENFQNQSTAKNRQAKRARVLLAAKLQTPYGELDARLRDLSRKGALVECSPTPPTGSEVLFIRGTITVPARVAWAGVGKVGLEFLYMIDEQDVLVQLKRIDNGPKERFRRPGIKEEVSERDRKLASTWGVQVGINLPEEL
jgi:hypothetical protein